MRAKFARNTKKTGNTKKLKTNLPVVSITIPWHRVIIVVIQITACNSVLVNKFKEKLEQNHRTKVEVLNFKSEATVENQLIFN